MSQPASGWRVPIRNFLRMCRRNLGRAKIADSISGELTGADLLIRSLILRRLLRRGVLGSQETKVGLLLPPSNAAVLANAALHLDCRVPVNLNYSVSSEVLNICIARAGLRHVLTSRKVMERLTHLNVDCELVYLEDFKQRVGLLEKLVAFVQGRLLPIGVLERWLGLLAIQPDDLITIVFTSGSTGDPKGVMLTQHNVGSNVEGFSSSLQLSRDDVLVGILPFFHSFGYTANLWAGLMLEPKVVYHHNPLEPKQVGALAKAHGATILIAAPTFLRSFIRRCEPEEFARLNLVVTGAEKLPRDLADAFQQRFGVRPLEGYGATETSPVVSVNIPKERAVGSADAAREGTVGRCIPGVQVKVVDLDTGAELGPGRSGMLLVSGWNIMKGYLDRPDLTAEVMRDGWYVTGDIAQLDADGFITITGRESRFSKIGGEMVPHIRVEEAIGQVVTADPETVSMAVTSVPDARKGERLIVLYTTLAKPPEQICKELPATGLPPIWTPSPDSFHQVEAIPILGTGKVDLRKLKELAQRASET